MKLTILLLLLIGCSCKALKDINYYSTSYVTNNSTLVTNSLFKRQISSASVKTNILYLPIPYLPTWHTTHWELRDDATNYLWILEQSQDRTNWKSVWGNPPAEFYYVPTNSGMIFRLRGVWNPSIHR